MAAGEEIAKLFGTLGFKVDMKGVRKFEQNLDRLEKRLKRLSQSQAGQGDNSSRSNDRATRSVKKHADGIAALISRYDRYGGAIQKVREDYRRINQMYRDGNITAERRNEILSRTIKRYRHLQRVREDYERYGSRGRGRPGRLGPKMNSAVAGFVPGFGAAFAGMQSVQSYQQAVGMEQGLIAATGSTEKAAEDMEYLQKVAQDLGLYIGHLGRAFTGMSAAARGTSLAGQPVRDIFEGISSQARVLNLSAADTEGIFRAVTQIMNKQQVMAEELKNQLGERMPGAIQATARAMGVLKVNGEADTQTLFKMMEAGDLTADEVLPKLAAEMRRTAETGGALARSVQNTGSQINRFRTAVWNANRTFNESGFDAAVNDLFQTMAEAIQKATPLWDLLGRSMVVFGKAIEAPIELAGTLASKLGFMTEEGFKVNDSMKMAAVGLTAALRPLRRIAYWVLILPAAFAAVNHLIENGFDGKGFKEIAVQIGLIVFALGAMIGPLSRILKLAGGIGRVAKKIQGMDRRGSRGNRGGSSAPDALDDAARRQRDSDWGSNRGGWWDKVKGFGGKAAGWASTAAKQAPNAAVVGWGVKQLVDDVQNSQMYRLMFSDQNAAQIWNTDLSRFAVAQRGGQASIPYSAEEQQRMQAPQSISNLNGDVVFNITTNDPEEVGSFVEDRFLSFIRNEQQKNPIIEQ